jgi:hypothetical protein
MIIDMVSVTKLFDLPFLIILYICVSTLVYKARYSNVFKNILAKEAKNVLEMLNYWGFGRLCFQDPSSTFMTNLNTIISNSLKSLSDSVNIDGMPLEPSKVQIRERIIQWIGDKSNELRQNIEFIKGNGDKVVQINISKLLSENFQSEDLIQIDDVLLKEEQKGILKNRVIEAVQKWNGATNGSSLSVINVNENKEKQDGLIDELINIILWDKYGLNGTLFLEEETEGCRKGRLFGYAPINEKNIFNKHVFEKLFKDKPIHILDTFTSLKSIAENNNWLGRDKNGNITEFIDPKFLSNFSVLPTTLYIIDQKTNDLKPKPSYKIAAIILLVILIVFIIQLKAVPSLHGFGDSTLQCIYLLIVFFILLIVLVSSINYVWDVSKYRLLSYYIERSNQFLIGDNTIIGFFVSLVVKLQLLNFVLGSMSKMSFSKKIPGPFAALLYMVLSSLTFGGVFTMVEKLSMSLPVPLKISSKSIDFRKIVFLHILPTCIAVFISYLQTNLEKNAVENNKFDYNNTLKYKIQLNLIPCTLGAYMLLIMNGIPEWCGVKEQLYIITFMVGLLIFSAVAKALFLKLYTQLKEFVFKIFRSLLPKALHKLFSKIFETFANIYTEKVKIILQYLGIVP